MIYKGTIKFHVQDQETFCGAACAMMILGAPPDPDPYDTLIQSKLMEEICKHNKNKGRCAYG